MSVSVRVGVRVSVRASGRGRVRYMSASTWHVHSECIVSARQVQ